MRMDLGIEILRIVGYAGLLVSGVVSFARFIPMYKAMPVAATRAEVAAASDVYEPRWELWLLVVSVVCLSVVAVLEHVVPSWEWHDALLLGAQACFVLGFVPLVALRSRLQPQTRATITGVLIVVMMGLGFSWIAVRA